MLELDSFCLVLALLRGLALLRDPGRAYGSALGWASGWASGLASGVASGLASGLALNYISQFVDNLDQAHNVRGHNNNAKYDADTDGHRNYVTS